MFSKQIYDVMSSKKSGDDLKTAVHDMETERLDGAGPQVESRFEMDGSNDSDGKDDKEFEKEIERLTNDLKFALAETENLRKRHAKEREELLKFATSSALSELVVPFEHLFSALKIEIPEPLQEDGFVNSLTEGMIMIRKEFEKVFGKLGLKRIFPEGEKFDHKFHQAIAQVEDDTKEAGDIMSVVSAGFELHGRVIKPAMVVVVKSA